MSIRDEMYALSDYEQYAAQHPDNLLELIDGRIVEKVTSERHGKLAGWLLHLLIVFLEANPQVKGHWSTESSYKPVGDAYNARRPDVAFRVDAGPVSTTAVYDGMPDFCVEIKSPSNSYDQLRAKAEFYLAHGAHLVWLVYPEPQLVEVYEADGTSAVYKAGQTLSGGAVLPGFSVPVSKVFAV